MIVRKHFLLLFVFLLVACGSAEPTPEPTIAPTDVPPTIPPEPTTTPVPPPVSISTVDDSADSAPYPVEEPVEEEVEAVVMEPTPTLAARVWYPDNFGYGIQSHATVGDPGYAMDVIANQLGLHWVKVQLRWEAVQSQPDYYDWSIWDAIVNEADEQGLFLMFSVVTSPAWSRADGNPHGPPDDRTLYYKFLAEVIARYDGRVHAIEVWNEQNLDREWQTENGVAPVDYVEFLAESYETIKTSDPNIIVISGALSPTGVHDPEKKTVMNDAIWFDEAIGLGMLDHLDCVGVHHNGYNLPPDIGFDEVEQVGTADDYTFKGPWGNPHYSWSFKSTLEMMAEKAQAVRPELKLCVTEFGWGSSEGYNEYPTGFEFFLDNTLEEQATWIPQAFNQMRRSGDVMLAFLFNLDYGNKGQGPTDDPVPYSIIDTNGAPRPAWGAISALEKDY